MDARPLTRARLFVVRHGRTAGNGDRYLGWADEPLDDVGREQAQALGERLAREDIDVVYASPLSRALDTARPIAARQAAPLRAREELKEIDYGRYQGLRKGAHKLRVRKHHRYDAMPGGESLHDVFRRVGRVYDDLRCELHAGRNVAAVGHFWSLRMLVGVLAGRRFDELSSRSPEFTPENGSALRVDVRPEAGDRLRVERASWI
jgi:broad specificity phosphatase PhoE